MSMETPKNKPEKTGDAEEEKNGVEGMLTEDFQLMIDEIPILRNQLQEWEIKLADLEKDPSTNAEEIEKLKSDIKDYQNQLYEREELLEG